jgi:hypothetical protein
MSQLKDQQIQELERQRDELIAGNPQLQRLQSMLDKLIRDIEDPTERLVLINHLMLKMFQSRLIPASMKIKNIQKNLLAMSKRAQSQKIS